MKKFLISLLLILGLLAPASAQITVTPQPGITSGYLAKQTYSAGFFGLVPPASATDMICLTGSASKVVRLQSIRLGGTAGTLVTLPIQVVRRVTADTGGTAASTTANPANTITLRDSGQGGAATAIPISYTAVPTINDTSPVYIDSALVTLGTTAAATNPIMTLLDYAKDVENNVQPPTLRGAAQQICINFNTVSVSSGVLNGSITWTEE